MPVLAAAAWALLFWADPVPSAKQAFDHAVAAMSNGDYAAAERGFQQVLKIEPKNIGALGNLGVVFRTLAAAFTGDGAARLRARWAFVFVVFFAMRRYTPGR